MTVLLLAILAIFAFGHPGHFASGHFGFDRLAVGISHTSANSNYTNLMLEDTADLICPNFTLIFILYKVIIGYNMQVS